MNYTIKEVADRAGVTTRTIRYYDEIGLLEPASVGENGYRYYDSGSLLRLQQILFFRELDVPLKEIERIMGDADFDPVAALESHRDQLQTRAERLFDLLETVDKTILMLKGERTMTDNEVFDGFDETKYQEEAEKLWGDEDKYKTSMNRWGSFSKAKQEEVKALGGEIIQRMVTDRADARPDDADVQAAVAEYLAYFNEYFYPCDAEFMRGLAELWVADPRFAKNYDGVREGGAAFVREAVTIFADGEKNGK